MQWCTSEPNLTEILADPLVRTLMRADRVDPRTLETELRSTADRIDRDELAVNPLAVPRRHLRCV